MVNNEDLTPKKEIPNGSQRYKLEWAPLFLRVLRATGNIRASAEAAGITRAAAYLARDTVARFRRDWDDALNDAIDRLEIEARNRALNGSDVLLIFLLKAHRPQLYADRLRIQLELQKAKDDTIRLFIENGLTEAEALAEVESILASNRSK